MQILGTKVDQFSKQNVLSQIRGVLRLPKTKTHHLVTTNPEFVIEAQKNQKFQDIINDSWLSVADGYGLRLAAKYIELSRDKKTILFKILSGLRVAWWGLWRHDQRLDVIEETITGVDLVSEISEVAHQLKKESGHSNPIFLLGGFGDVPQKTARVLKGQLGQDLDIMAESFEVGDPVARVNDSGATILFLALNHPRAQLWINDNISKMKSVKLAVGVGGSFDYLAGEVKMAPQGARYHFEWLFRLFYQPKRWKRICQAVCLFPWLVFQKSILDKK